MSAGARLRALLVMRRRLDAQFLTELASFDSQGFAEGYGFASTQAWLRGYGYLDSGQAGSLVASARTADRLPLLAEVLAHGRIGIEHVAAVSRSTKRVPDEVLVEHDSTLRDMTTWARPSDLSRVGQKITECWDHDAAESDDHHLTDSRRLSLAQTFHGLWAVEGALTAEDGVKLAAALEPLMRRRGPEDERTPTQRRADALAELVDIALRSGQLPDTGGDRTRITLLVHATAAALELLPHDVDSPGPDGHGPGCHELDVALPDVALLDAVQSDAGQPSTIPRQRGSGGSAAADCGTVDNLFADSRLVAAFGDGASARQLLGSRCDLTTAALTRIGCDAEINLMLLDGCGEVLHHGYSTRFPLVAQRRALVVRDQGCVFPGCDRPPHACQAHHLRFWSLHGPTDIDNLALVCGFHHWLIHDRHWDLARLPVSATAPAGGWVATSPHGLRLVRQRQPSAWP